VQISSGLVLSADEAARSAPVLGVVFHDHATQQRVPQRIIGDVLFNHRLVRMKGNPQLVCVRL
jgi:hypothetical protein